MVGFLEVVGNSGGFNIYTGISSLEEWFLTRFLRPKNMLSLMTEHQIGSQWVNTIFF